MDNKPFYSSINQTLANNRKVLASRIICLTAATAAMTPKMEKTTAILKFIQKTALLLEGLKVELKKTTGNTKSSGRNPNAPIIAFMSPKNGSIAAIIVAATTDIDRDITLGMTFLLENSSLFGSPNILSNISFVGCKYTCHSKNIEKLVSA